MGGGLMQLVAYGAQDVYLTGNPQITFFKVVYRRHTNFSIESIRQVWQGDAVNNDKTAEAIISRNGDLVCGMHIELSRTDDTIGTTQGNIAVQTIKDIELQIGGQKIDKQTGAFMTFYQQLTDPRYPGTDSTHSAAAKASGNLGVEPSASKLYIPLQFWFCRNPGLALPLIALQYHEVKVILNTTTKTTLQNTTSDLYADYIYLDTDERKRFAQVSHEYLIEQVQYRFFGPGKLKFDLGFINHPVKELLWINGRIDDKGYFWNDIYGTGLARPVDVIPRTKWKLRLNGHDRFSERWTSYFARKQVADYHSGGLNAQCELLDKVAVYSFALKPEEHQPSGTCNFSRIDSAELLSSTELKASNGTPMGLEVYAINYNVLRVMSGMGGLAYSN